MNGDDHARIGLGWGIAVWIALVSSFNYGPILSAIIIPISWVSAKLPDMDHDKTKIGRKRKAITSLSSNMLTGTIIAGIVGGTILIIASALQLADTGINSSELMIVVIGLVIFAIVRKFITSSDTFKWVTKHRGLMHTLIIPALLFMAIHSLPSEIIRTILIGINTGYISHLFADILTKDGCPLLFPITRASIHILNLTTSDYKKNKQGKRVKKKVDDCKVASYIVAALSILISIVVF